MGSITDIWDPVKIAGIREIIKTRQQDGWDEAWSVYPCGLSDWTVTDTSSYRQKEVTPWDAGQLQPPLKELIESKRLPLPTTGRALVPGCGKVDSTELTLS